MSDWQQRYINMNGNWPHPDSPAGQGMSFHDFYKLERLQRAKNVMQAVWFAKGKLIVAVREETGEALDDVLSGILPGILTALVTVAATTLVGFSLGALGGAVAGAGVGAVPGSVVGGSLGFSVGMWILEWMGLAFLAAHVGKNMYQVGRLIEQGFYEAWGRGARHWSSMSYQSDMMPCHHDVIPGFRQVTAASEKFARAVAILIRLVLEGVVIYLTARGVSRLPELVAQLKNSRLGEGFAVWVEKNHQSLMRNPKLTQRAGGGEAAPAKVLDHTVVPEQPRPGKAKKTSPKNKLLTKSELENWYKNQGKKFQDPKYLESHIEGTDLSKPIIRKEIEPGTEIIQYVRTGKKPGMYAAYPGTSPEALAIDGTGRELVTFRLKSPLNVVESSAASYPAGKVPGVGGPGGGKQLLLPQGWEDSVEIIQ